MGWLLGGKGLIAESSVTPVLRDHACMLRNAAEGNLFFAGLLHQAQRPASEKDSRGLRGNGVPGLP